MSSGTTNKGFYKYPEGFDEWWKIHHDVKEVILSYTKALKDEMVKSEEALLQDREDGSSCPVSFSSSLGDGSNERKYQYIFPLWKVSDRLRDDAEVVKAVIDSYVHVSTKLSATPSSHSPRHPPLIRWAGQNCRDDKDVVMFAIEHDYRAIEYASSRLRDDEDVVMFAVSRSCSAIGFASSRLLSDEDFVLQVVTNYEYAVSPLLHRSDRYEGIMNHLPAIYHDNHDVVLGCAKKNALVLNVASERLRNEFEIVRTAVSQDGMALEFASTTMKDDYDIALRAVTNNGMSLLYCSPRLNNNRSLVFEAVKSDGHSMAYASDELKDDLRFVLTAVHYSGEAFFHLPERLRCDTQVAAVAVSNMSVLWRFLRPSFQNDFDVAFSYVSNHKTFSCRCPLADLNAELRNDRRIVLAAVSKDPRNFCHVTEELKRDPEVILTFMQTMLSSRESLEVVNPREYEADMVGLIDVDVVDKLDDLYEDLAGKTLTYGSIQKSYSSCQRKSSTTKDVYYDDPEAWLQSQWERVWLVTKVKPEISEEESGNDFDWTDIQKHIISYIGPEQFPGRYEMIKDCWPILEEICMILHTPFIED